MNGQARLLNVVADQVEHANDIIERLQDQGESLVELFGEERRTFQLVQAAATSYEDLVDAAIVALDYEANTLKEGPLAGIARTSDAYKLAVKGLRSDLSRGSLKREYAQMKMAEVDHQSASIQYEKAKIRMGALKAVAELQSSLLRAIGN